MNKNSVLLFLLIFIIFYYIYLLFYIIFFQDKNNKTLDNKIINNDNCSNIINYKEAFNISNTIQDDNSGYICNNDMLDSYRGEIIYNSYRGEIIDNPNTCGVPSLSINYDAESDEQAIIEQQKIRQQEEIKEQEAIIEQQKITQQEEIKEQEAIIEQQKITQQEEIKEQEAIIEQKEIIQQEPIKEEEAIIEQQEITEPEPVSDSTQYNPCGWPNREQREGDINNDCVYTNSERLQWKALQEEKIREASESEQTTRSQVAKQSSEKKIKYIYFRCKYKGSAFSVHEVECYLKSNNPNGVNIIRNSKYVSSATFTRPQNFNNTHDNPTQFIGNGSRSADNGINGKTIDSRNYALGKPRPKSGPTKDGLDNYNNYLITITPIDGSDGDIIFSDIERIVVHNAYQYGTKPKGGGSQRYGETVESVELLDKNKQIIAIHSHNNQFDTLGKKYINYIGPSDPSTYGVNRGKYMKSGKESLTFDLTQV